MTTTIQEIIELGFTGFKTVAEIRNNSTIIPKTKGVYFIIHTNPKKVIFLEVGTGGYFKGKNPNVSNLELKNNWVDNSMIVYIGQAGGNGSSNTLNKRIKQYLDFGNGRNVGHYGGRFIWQIENSNELVIAWKEIKEEDPLIIEKNLLSMFNNYHGKLPFANLKF